MTASSFLAEAGCQQEAAQELEAAVDLGWRGVSNAHKAQWKRKLASTYVRLGNYDRAARSLNDAVRFAPRSGEAWRDLARVDLALKRYSESIAAYERADRLHALRPADYQDLAEAKKQAAATH
jgi:tetratricopeptide (TPR) repeat protein